MLHQLSLVPDNPITKQKMHCICCHEAAVMQAHNGSGDAESLSLACRSSLVPPKAVCPEHPCKDQCRLVWMPTCGEGCKWISCNAGILASKQCWQVCKDVLGCSGHHFIIGHTTCTMAAPGLNRQHCAHDLLTLLNKTLTKRTCQLPSLP